MSAQKPPKRKLTVLLNQEVQYKLSVEVERRRKLGQKATISGLIASLVLNTHWDMATERKESAQKLANSLAHLGLTTGTALEQLRPEPLKVEWEEVPEEVIDWRSCCTADFGAKVLGVAPRVVRGWDKMDWESRHRALSEIKEREA